MGTDIARIEKIENWKYLFGSVRGECNGQYIWTSQVVSKQEDVREGEVISTIDSKYLLGKEKV